MEKEKSIKLIKKWILDEGRFSGVDNPAKGFVTWLYKKGFTIETRFQGKDLKKQEELYDSKKQ